MQFLGASLITGIFKGRLRETGGARSWFLGLLLLDGRFGLRFRLSLATGDRHGWAFVFERDVLFDTAAAAWPDNGCLNWSRAIRVSVGGKGELEERKLEGFTNFS